MQVRVFAGEKARQKAAAEAAAMTSWDPLGPDGRKIRKQIVTKQVLSLSNCVCVLSQLLWLPAESGMFLPDGCKGLVR